MPGKRAYFDARPIARRTLARLFVLGCQNEGVFLDWLPKEPDQSHCKRLFKQYRSLADADELQRRAPHFLHRSQRTLNPRQTLPCPPLLERQLKLRNDIRDRADTNTSESGCATEVDKWFDEYFLLEHTEIATRCDRCRHCGMTDTRL